MRLGSSSPPLSRVVSPFLFSQNSDMIGIDPAPLILVQLDPVNSGRLHRNLESAAVLRQDRLAILYQPDIGALRRRHIQRKIIGKLESLSCLE